MPGNLNRAQLRDAIRHELNRRTLFDVTGVLSDVGKVNPSFPWPSDVQCNEAIDLVIRNLNSECRFGVNNSLSIPVAAQTAAGAFYIDLSTAYVPSPYLPGYIDDIRRVVWTDGSGVDARLDPTLRAQMDRQNEQWQAEGPGTPQGYWIEGYALALWPAPILAGTVTMIAGQGLLSFMSDTDFLDGLPADYSVPALIYGTAAELAGQRTQDVEMVTASQRCYGLYQAALGNIKFWLVSNNAAATPGFGLRTLRRGQGLMRSRR